MTIIGLHRSFSSNKIIIIDVANNNPIISKRRLLEILLLVLNDISSNIDSKDINK